MSSRWMSAGHRARGGGVPSFRGTVAERMEAFRKAAEEEKAKEQKQKEAEIRKLQKEEEEKENGSGKVEGKFTITITANNASATKASDEKYKDPAAIVKRAPDQNSRESTADLDNKMVENPENTVNNTAESIASDEQADDATETSQRKKSVAPCRRKKQKAQRTKSISNIVMEWVQEMTEDYPGVAITNFSTSWRDGLAFCALIHRFNPDEFDFNELSAENRRHNFDLAFNTGKRVKNIPILLDTEDLVRMKRPEPRSVQTYVMWVWRAYGPQSGKWDQEEIQNAQLA